jgi:hypothetical protein
VDLERAATGEDFKEDDTDGPHIKGRVRHDVHAGCVSVDGLRRGIPESATHAAACACTWKLSQGFAKETRNTGMSEREIDQ